MTVDPISSGMRNTQTTVCLFFVLLGGIRCGELGGVMHGEDQCQAENGEFLRLAIPRRTYTESHLKYKVYSVDGILFWCLQ